MSTGRLDPFEDCEMQNDFSNMLPSSFSSDWHQFEDLIKNEYYNNALADDVISDFLNYELPDDLDPSILSCLENDQNDAPNENSDPHSTLNECSIPNNCSNFLAAKVPHVVSSSPSSAQRLKKENEFLPTYESSSDQIEVANANLLNDVPFGELKAGDCKWTPDHKPKNEETARQIYTETIFNGSIADIVKTRKRRVIADKACIEIFSTGNSTVKKVAVVDKESCNCSLKNPVVLLDNTFNKLHSLKYAQSSDEDSLKNLILNSNECAGHEKRKKDGHKNSNKQNQSVLSANIKPILQQPLPKLKHKNESKETFCKTSDILQLSHSKSNKKRKSHHGKHKKSKELNSKLQRQHSTQKRKSKFKLMDIQDFNQNEINDDHHPQLDDMQNIIITIKLNNSDSVSPIATSDTLPHAKKKLKGIEEYKAHKAKCMQKSALILNDKRVDVNSASCSPNQPSCSGSVAVSPLPFETNESSLNSNIQPDALFNCNTLNSHLDSDYEGKDQIDSIYKHELKDVDRSPLCNSSLKKMPPDFQVMQESIMLPYKIPCVNTLASQDVSNSIGCSIIQKEYTPLPEIMKCPKVSSPDIKFKLTSLNFQNILCPDIPTEMKAHSLQNDLCLKDFKPQSITGNATFSISCIKKEKDDRLCENIQAFQSDVMPEKKASEKSTLHNGVCVKPEATNEHPEKYSGHYSTDKRPRRESNQGRLSVSSSSSSDRLPVSYKSEQKARRSPSYSTGSVHQANSHSTNSTRLKNDKFDFHLVYCRSPSQNSATSSHSRKNGVVSKSRHKRSYSGSSGSDNDFGYDSHSSKRERKRSVSSEFRRKPRCYRYRKHSKSCSRSPDHSSSKYSRKSRSTYKKKRRYSSSYSSASSGSRFSSTSRSRSPSIRHQQYYRCPTSKKQVWQEQQKQIDERRVVYVGRIPDRYSREDLRSRFSSFGHIEDVRIHVRATRMNDNFGFITFREREAAYKAVDFGNGPSLEPKFDISFGGRRRFCKKPYSDLDKEEETNVPRNFQSPHQEHNFDALLKAELQRIKSNKKY